MCIYCKTTNYRKIYENHFGKIPKDTEGRTYHIHHSDGNRENNDPSNLEALSIKDHYARHHSQGDWVACHRLAIIMQRTPDEVSKLASLNAKKQVSDGTHPWLNSDIQSKNTQRQLINGTHSFMKRADGTSIQAERVKNGTHHLLGGEIQSKSGKKRANEGTLGFQNPNNQKKAHEASLKTIKQRITEGTWNLQNKEFHINSVRHQLKTGRHCSQITKICEYCEKTVDAANYSRSHGEKCSVFTGITRILGKQPPRETKTCPICTKTMDVSNFSRHGHGIMCRKPPI